MTAEGAVRSSASEAPKAELAAVKVVVADTQAGERPVEELERVGSPFVIVNGDSDGLSDWGSDMSTRPEVNSPSDEEDLPRSSAGPYEEAGGDHGTSGVGLGGLDVAIGVSSPNGHGRATVESVVESKDLKAEPGELGIASGELGGADNLAKLGVDHADSAAPAVDSEVNGKSERKKGVAGDTELHEVATEEQHVEVNVATEPSALDYAPMNAESSSTVLESEVCGEDSKGEQIAAETMEKGTHGSGASVVNGHHNADMSVDSCVTSTEPASHADEGKQELVEKDATCGQQAGIDDLHGNKHMNADSSTPASEFEAHAYESEGQQIEAPITEAEVLDGTLAASSDCDACTCREPTEEETVPNGHDYTKDNADASGQLEPGVDEGEGEATCGVIALVDITENDSEANLHDECTSVVALEEITENDSEENLHDGRTAVVASSDEEATPPMQEGIDEVVPAVAGTGLVTRNNCEQIVQDDVVCTSKPELSFVELNEDQKVKVEIAGDENITGSDVKSTLEMDTSVSVQTEDLTSTVEDRNIPLHVNLSDKVEEKEVNNQSPLASTSPSEPRSFDLVDNDTVKQTNLVPESESYDHVQAEECSSQAICRTIVDQVTPVVSMEHGTAVIDDLVPRCQTGDTCHDKSSETAVDRSVALNEDKSTGIDDVKLCSASSTTGDKCSSPKNELVSSVDEPHRSDVSLESGVKAPFAEVKAPIADNETCTDICSENVNAYNKSSHEAETKCLEVLQPSSVETVILEGHKDDDEQAHKEEKIVEDSSESHVDLDMNKKGDIQVIRPQKIFIVRVPRLASEEDWQRIQDAQAHLDQLTQERDVLNIRKKKQKAVFDEYRVKYEAASREENEARAAHGDKRNDLESVRSMIGKLNKANSIEEIDEKIVRKEMIMQHETISLKDEKLFIKEINELKAERKQLCSNIGSEAEISELFHQKEHIHEQHKTLKKDYDVLFQNLKSLGENTRKIKRSLDDERAVLRKINDELQIANEVRQEAYANWVALRGQPARKNKNFFMYKSDRTTAYKHLQTGDMDVLQSYCNNQIEKVLKIWNKDDDFRKLYVEANTASTLRRLGTHDGRKLGLEENPPVIPSYNFNRIPSNPSPLTVSSLPIITSEAAPPKPIPVPVPVEDNSFPDLPLPQTAKQVKSKASGSSVQKEITAAPASEREDVEDIEKEKARLMEELEVKRKAEELARREEELRQERAAAEKERLRLEQKAKAKEAEERKKKKAEKAQERAEFKTRKEAEMKEKKKAKKDKKTAPTDLANGGGDGNSAAIATAETDSNASENARDTELSQQAAPRRTARPAVAMRQLNRLQPMPLPLRNRGRRRMRQYILIGVAIAALLVALLLAVKYFQFPSSPLN